MDRHGPNNLHSVCHLPLKTQLHKVGLGGMFDPQGFRRVTQVHFLVQDA